MDQSTTIADTPITFPEAKPIDLCSWNECLLGHRWSPSLAVAKCPGCGGQILAVQKTNCPVCNEPVTKTSLRSDFVGRGAGVSPRCLGQKPLGESVDLEMERVEWQQVVKSPIEVFEDRRVKERNGESKG